jgi:hypothetical protein
MNLISRCELLFLACSNKNVLVLVLVLVLEPGSDDFAGF